ncbi:hypothetical protein DH2020_005103 [Rehmannia glutinosa]|uniref:Tf2-1-like SH3-like domain-containing protein n=1 Tax=Rehmannia glutinosa TaxID=99300 RepID=A0ABR0XRB7_REHGL
MAPYEALYGRKYRSPLHWEIDDQWTQRETKVTSIPKVDLVREAMEKVKPIKSRQKSYAGKSRKDLEFKVGDEIFLRLSSWKGLINPKKGGKLSLRYVGPYKILQMIGKLAYRLELPTQYAGMHNVFHVLRLKKYRLDPEHIIIRDAPPLMENLSYTEKPIRIIDRQIRQLRKREIPMVKMVW